MALDARLTIEDKYSYDVQSLDYTIKQTTDPNTGQPTADPHFGSIDFNILANNEDDCLFQRWVSSKDLKKNGEFALPITEGIYHKNMYLKFKDAFCTKLEVHYASYNEKQMYMRVSIQAKEMTFGNQSNSAIMTLINKFLSK